MTFTPVVLTPGRRREEREPLPTLTEAAQYVYDHSNEGAWSIHVRETAMSTNTIDVIAEGDLDRLLLETAASEKVQQVDGITGGALQSHTARAWTLGGAVD